MSLKHGLLGLLCYEPMTGYELDKVFKGSLGYFWHAKGSQIYSELDSMERKGWLTSERVMQEEKPNKRVYTVTDKGKTEFMDWISSPEADIKNAVNIKSPFLMRVFFSGETPKSQTLELLRSFRDVCLARIVAIDEAKEDIPTGEPAYIDQAIYWKLTASYGEIMNRARIEWADKAIATLETHEPKTNC